MSIVTPWVCIDCLVYNHEPYLRDCLDGFVMQQTNFPFVAIVHDDASTDNSAAIIREYAEKYPEIIKPIFETENQYSKHDGSLSRIMNNAIDSYNPKYIAMCEGDDYWIDPLKLQKQVDILEMDTSLMGCVTKSIKVDQNGKALDKDSVINVYNKAGKYNLRDFMGQNPLYPTATILLRYAHIEDIRTKTRIMSNPYFDDWTAWIANHIFGDFYFLDEITAAYRINPTSVTHNNIDKRRLGLAKENFKINKNVRSILPDEYADIRKDLENTAWIWYNLANAYKHIHKYLLMIGCLFISGIKDPKFLYHKLKSRHKKTFH